jgi:site-specific recombinase XerD
MRLLRRLGLCESSNGKQPYWPNSIYRVYIKPAAESIGITKRLGWHTFRHTFATILTANGVNQKVIQELLRHATLKVTWTLMFKPRLMTSVMPRTRLWKCFFPECGGQ